MKKSLLFSALCFCILSVSSQVCTPDTTHFASGSYVYPDSLPCISRHTAYTGTINLMVPDSLEASDFVAAAPAGLFFHIDSIRIDSITGYPTGFSAATNPVYGVWIHGGGYGCGTFSGATSDTAGTYPLNIYGRGCGHVTIAILGTIDSCITGSLSSFFKYNLKVCNATGISEVPSNLSLNIYPNPNQGAFTVTVSSASHVNGTMSVLDELGRTIQIQSMDVNGTKQIPLELSNLSAGSYLLEVNTNNGRSVKQFIVK